MKQHTDNYEVREYEAGKCGGTCAGRRQSRGCSSAAECTSSTAFIAYSAPGAPSRPHTATPAPPLLPCPAGKWLVTNVTKSKFELAYTRGISRLMKFFKGSNDKVRGGAGGDRGHSVLHPALVKDSAARLSFWAGLGQYCRSPDLHLPMHCACPCHRRRRRWTSPPPPWRECLCSGPCCACAPQPVRLLELQLLLLSLLTQSLRVSLHCLLMPLPLPPPCRQLKLDKGGESSEKDYSFSLWIPQEFQVGEPPRCLAVVGWQEAGGGLAGGRQCRDGWEGRWWSAKEGSLRPARLCQLQRHPSLLPPPRHTAPALHPPPCLPQKDTPQPTDADLKVVEYEAITVYVRIFSGFATEGGWAGGRAGRWLAGCSYYAVSWCLHGPALCCPNLSRCCIHCHRAPPVHSPLPCVPCPPPPAGTILKETSSLHDILQDDDRDFDDQLVWAAVYDPPQKLLNRHNEIHVPYQATKKQPAAA